MFLNIYCPKMVMQIVVTMAYFVPLDGEQYRSSQIMQYLRKGTIIVLTYKLPVTRSIYFHNTLILLYTTSHCIALQLF